MATTATDENGRTRSGKRAHPDKVERDKLMRLVERITNKMHDLQEEAVELGYERRHALVRLNRDLGVPYSQLCEATGLAQSRITLEIHRAKEEAGIETPHPRYPNFGRNGRRR